MQNLSTQKRVLLATLLSFIFFIVYDYFFIPKQQAFEQNQSIEKTSNQQTIQQINQAPTTTQKNISKDHENQTNTIVTIKAKEYEAQIDSLGRISKFYLNNAQFNTENGDRLQLISKLPLPLEIRFNDTSLNDLAFKTPYKANIEKIDLENGESSVELTQDLGQIKIIKKINFKANGSYDISINLNKPVEYFITPGIRPNIAVDNYTVHGVLLQNNKDSLEIIEDDTLKSAQNFNDINIIADSDRYYTTLLYSLDKSLNVVVDTDKTKDNNSIAWIKSKEDLNLNGYIGSKTHKILESINPKLINVIEYGWFSFIAKPMFKFLEFLHNYIGNWGWAIVVLTLIVRIVLFPLTYKGMLSMNKLKELAPKVKELQAKYKGDPQKLNMHMMELYKKNGANPMGGCLPILLQIPIFFAIYRVLLNAIELKAAPWIFWINDLSVMDPYFVLPILMGITMFLQQKLTPTTFTDPMQEKIMKYLPLIFTFFFVTFPSGLTLYWFVNNVCSVVQQLFVNRLFKNQKNIEVK